MSAWRVHRMVFCLLWIGGMVALSKGFWFPGVCMSLIATNELFEPRQP